MRTIAHISDLHFGRLNEATLPALRASLEASKPDLVVVSGDLTQRARSHEFLEAWAYLDSLPKPQIVVPGNHDVPLYNIFARWFTPLTKFRKYICDNLEPLFADQEIAVLGLNTARSFTIKDGRLNSEQVERTCRIMKAHADANMRVLVTHHPFDVSDPDQSDDIVGRAKMAMDQFARCGVDLILTGHTHSTGIARSGPRYGVANTTLFIQAGTATSSRQRKEQNAWNLIQIVGDTVSIQRTAWDAADGQFKAAPANSFKRSADGWSQV